MAVTCGAVDAEDAKPGDFPQNGWVAHTLQSAWTAIHRTGFDLAGDRTATPDASRLAVQHVINAGGDTDTVAAITSTLAGALAVSLRSSADSYFPDDLLR